MIPRVGDEVLVKYLNVDPDQPIVVGVFRDFFGYFIRGKMEINCKSDQ